jgi:hypothetical protein
MSGEQSLQTAMRAITGALRGPAISDVLAILTTGVLETLPSFDYASITARTHNDVLDTLVASDPWIVRCDELQRVLHEGPAFDAVSTASFLASADVARDSRWPEYGPRVAVLGIVSQLALFLPEKPNGGGSLNLYATHLVEIDQDTAEVAQLFADTAAAALSSARTVEQLAEALVTRHTTGEATGIIMERYRVDSKRAFAFLVRLSQSSNTKLRVIAEQIVHDGPDAPTFDIGRAGPDTRTTVDDAEAPLDPTCGP